MEAELAFDRCSGPALNLPKYNQGQNDEKP
jgi:hypothetical protein